MLKWKFVWSAMRKGQKKSIIAAEDGVVWGILHSRDDILLIWKNS